MSEPRPLTDAELAAFRHANDERRALKAKTSAGEWEADTDSVEVFFNDDRTVIAAEIATPADALFIAHAHNDRVENQVDALLAEIERLKSHLKNLPPGSVSYAI